MARKGRDYMAVCGQCMGLIKLDEILPLIRRGLRVEHECGKVLHAGKEKRDLFDIRGSIGGVIIDDTDIPPE
jgi:hypothetical protein